MSRSPLTNIQHAEAVSKACLETDGYTTQEVRKEVRERAAMVAMKNTPAAPGLESQITQGVRTFIDALARDARDADVDDVLNDGYSDDGALEVAVNAAVGAGFTRLEHGLRALEESEQ